MVFLLVVISQLFKIFDLEWISENQISKQVKFNSPSLWLKYRAIVMQSIFLVLNHIKIIMLLIVSGLQFAYFNYTPQLITFSFYSSSTWREQIFQKSENPLKYSINFQNISNFQLSKYDFILLHINYYLADICII